MIRCALLLAAALLAQPASAELAGDGVSWLTRMVTAAQRLSYSGTFVYQSGEQSETSRVVRIVDASGERERLEVLDGSPREVVRVNDEVRCYLPDDRRVIIERRSARRSFPSLLAGMSKGIEEHYAVRVGEIERIAGVDARMIVLEPRDNWRYGYRLWADIGSGLLIKARTVDDKGNLVEQFAFTQFSIGGAAEPGGASSRLEAQSAGWRVEQLDEPHAAVQGDPPWRIRQGVPGFVRTADSMRRLKEGAPDVTHVVYSDGMAAVSLFIGAAGPAGTKPGISRQGAVHVYSRRVGDLKVTAVGEVPMVTVRRFAELVEPVRP